MTRLFIAFLMVFYSSVLLAQISPREAEKRFTKWVNGTVVLVTGDTVRCELGYNQMFSEGLVMVKEEENVLTLSVKDVKSFYFFDEKEEKTRRFLTVPLDMYQNQNTREFFLEYIYGNNKIAILNHRFIRIVVTNNYYGQQHRNPLPQDYFYLINIATGEILSMTKSNALLLVNDKADVISKFIKSNKIKLKSKVIKFRDTENYIRLFDYYQSIS